LREGVYAINSDGVCVGSREDLRLPLGSGRASRNWQTLHWVGKNELKKKSAGVRPGRNERLWKVPDPLQPGRGEWFAITIGIPTDAGRPSLAPARSSPPSRGYRRRVTPPLTTTVSRDPEDRFLAAGGRAVPRGGQVNVRDHDGPYSSKTGEFATIDILSCPRNRRSLMCSYGSSSSATTPCPNRGPAISGTTSFTPRRNA